jgi:hypothetical protein
MVDRAPYSRTKPRCGICGKRFKKGGARYRIDFEIVSDFDGHIEDFANKPKGYLEKKIAKILDETEDMTEEELEEEVYLKRNWLVCLSCRARFVRFLKELSE